MRTEQSVAVRAEAPERGMRFLLISLISLLVVSDLLDIKLSLGPGVTVENALLYILAVALVFKLIVQQPFIFQLRGLHMCFAALILYAIFSYLTAAFVIEYSRYDVVRNGMALKNRLVDQATYFLVFFYGLRESRNARGMLKVLLAAIALGSVIALLNAFGITQIGTAGENSQGRMEGLIGEPNQDAAFLCLFLPGFVALMFGSHGLWRAAWLVALVTSLSAFLLTASRGGMLGLILSAVWGAYLFRKYVPLSRIVTFASWAVGLLTLVLIAVSVRYGGLLYRRLIEDSTYTDVASASSGRIEMWTNALATMVEAPLTLLTGFGWEVYWLMPFRYAPHNHYVGLYFNLGLVGLICGVAFFALVVREARAAYPHAEAQHQSLLMAFAIGVLGIAIATFFVDLYKPWMWFWAYAGLVMRIAVNSRSQAARQSTPAPAKSKSVSRDPFGWAGAART